MVIYIPFFYHSNFSTTICFFILIANAPFLTSFLYIKTILTHQMYVQCDNDKTNILDSILLSIYFPTECLLVTDSLSSSLCRIPYYSYSLKLYFVLPFYGVC